MNIGRRDFLRGAGAFGALAAGGCATGGGLFSGGAGDFDESLAVFLSDIHVTGDDANVQWRETRRDLANRIAEILAMRPLPRHVVTFGDLSYDVGDPRDYRYAAKAFKVLEDAGVRVVHAVGNHDLRAPFRGEFPEAAESPVPGRIVTEVHFPSCDLLLLDSIVEKATDGDLGGEQLEWLGATLAGRTRPVIVGAHHAPDQIADLRYRGEHLSKILKSSPTAVGWINGHGHFWFSRPLVDWSASNQDAIPCAQLPAAGFWGEIGYAVFRAGETEARLELHESDFRFFTPLKPGEKRPRTWDTIVADKAGARCRFPFARAGRIS